MSYYQPREKKDILSGQRYASGSSTSGPVGSSGYFVETKGMKFLVVRFAFQVMCTQEYVPILSQK